jgi:hypothetical protein
MTTFFFIKEQLKPQMMKNKGEKKKKDKVAE